MTLRLAMDERMMLDAHTGVATYARGLRAAQRTICREAALIADRRDPDGPPPASWGRAGRGLRAVWGWTRDAVTLADERYLIPDLFRLIQVHFDLWGRPLRLRLPGPPGIVHWSYPLPVHVHGWQNVYTVHDAIPLTAPDLTPIDTRRHERLLQAIARRAAALVTVSNTARAEIAGALGCSPDRIVSCGQSVAAGPFSATPPCPSLRPQGYFLVVGAVERRKNIPAIVAAHRRSGSALPLVIAGPDGWGADTILADVAGPAILRLPFLPGPSLRRLIAEARGLLMVSHAEGFGLPIAEAMVLGTPVITSRRGAQAEAAGIAALQVDPDDVAAIADAISALDLDPALCAQLAARGLARAVDHSPERFVERLRAFYATLPLDGTVATG